MAQPATPVIEIYPRETIRRQPVILPFNGAFVFWMPAALHLCWALLIVAAGSVPNTTTLAAFRGSGLSPLVLAPILVGTSLLAFIALTITHRWAWLGLMPQQFVLMVSAATASVAALTGHYPDGTVPIIGIQGVFFVASDQVISILTWLFHSYALWFWAHQSVTSSTKDTRGAI